MEGFFAGDLVTWLRFDLLSRLLLATLLGGAVGYERERSGKPAGLRTNILICVGAALLTDLSLQFPRLVPGAGVAADPARIAAQIVSGIGFLGAGTIIQARGSVTGLTTAATLWVVAAIGMTAGAGNAVEAVGTTVLVLIVLAVLGWVETRFLERRSAKTLRVLLKGEGDVVERVGAFLSDSGLKVRLKAADWDPSGGVWIASYEIDGDPPSYERLRTEFPDCPEVRSYVLV